MKKLTVSFARFFFVACLSAASFQSFAAARPTDRIVRQAQQEVATAAADDWRTLAVAAEKCLSKGINVEEATDWLHRSLDIKETSYNLKLQGDVYARNGLAEAALESYSRSIRIGKLTDTDYADLATQHKIVTLIQQINAEKIQKEIAHLIQLGDAHAADQPQEALEYYSRSIRVGKQADSGYADAETQKKIVTLVEVLGHTLHHSAE